MIYLKDIGLFFAAILDFLLGFWVLFKNKKSELNISFSFLAFSVGTWTLSLLIFDFLPTITASFFCMGVVILSAGIIASSFLHFSIVFTNKSKYVSNWLKFSLYAPNILVVLAMLKPGILVKEIIFHPWGKESVLGFGYYFFGLYFSLFMTAGFIFLAKQFVVSRGQLRIQTAYILSGTLISAIFGSVFDLLFLFLGNFKYIWLGPYASFFWVVITAYAIVKHRLMDIEVIIRKGIIYSLLVSSVAALYAGVVLSAQILLQNYVTVPQWLLILLAASAIAAGFMPLENFIARATDRIFFKTRYEYQVTLKNISKKIALAKNLDELDSLVSSEISGVFKVKHAKIMRVE